MTTIGNLPFVSPSGGRTMWQAIFEQAFQTPAAIAIAAPSRSPLCFGDLQRHITTVAAALNAKGFRRNSRVALVLPNGPEMATAFLAVASCATCASLNPEYTAREFEFFLGHLQARALILSAGSDSPARAPAHRLGIRTIEIDSNPNGSAGLFTLRGAGEMSTQEAPTLARANDIALVLYTSGTTGGPKQVPLTHANLCASACHIATTLKLSANDRCLNILPLFHIHGLVAAVLASLAAGGTVACTPGMEDDRFFNWLDELRPTWYTGVPTMHQSILAGAHAYREAIQRNPLRFIRSSSAALRPQVAAELERCFNAPVIEAYGMTEAAHQVASNPLPPGARKPGSVGVAAGPEVAIMDNAGEMLPAGATGEIAIRGDNVTHGYASNPEANAEAFAAGWFRTGDQGFIDAEGFVYLTGRLTEIINRGGKKVFPHEVEDALLEHAAVVESAAFGVRHATLGEDIAAAVVLKEGATATADEIRTFLLDRLADFKIPSQLVLVGKIPRGATGKIERIHLEAELAGQLKRNFVAPRDATEARVAAIFSEVLGIGEVGVDDNFFALGGDSLRSFQVLARIRERLRADLSVVELFRGPTVAQIAREVSRLRCVTEAFVPEAGHGKVVLLPDEEADRRLQKNSNRK